MTKLLRPCVAELIGTFALVFVGIGVANNVSTYAPASVLTVALAHGLVVAVMVSATMHLSGGQLNPAVTLGLLVAGKITATEAIAYVLAQLLGAVLAAFLCLLLFDRAFVQSATPTVAVDLAAWKAVVIEALLALLMVYVVFGTGVDERGRKIGGLAMGLAYAAALLFSLPYTGAALNPAKAFGPALAANSWGFHYVYWLGPLIGGGAAGLLYNRLFLEHR